MIAAAELIKMHDSALDEWYSSGAESCEPGTDLDSVILAQHFCNYSIWNLEDQARRKDVADSRIAEVKRAIDIWNQKRNDLMEGIDRGILREFEGIATARAVLHSETAGMIIDRLSILSLKIRHMGANASRKDDPELASECAGKLAVLKKQRTDLAGCLAELIEGYRKGERYFMTYRQFKQYNDPRLNPALRNSAST